MARRSYPLRIGEHGTRGNESKREVRGAQGRVEHRRRRDLATVLRMRWAQLETCADTYRTSLHLITPGVKTEQSTHLLVSTACESSLDLTRSRSARTRDRSRDVSSAWGNAKGPSSLPG